MSSWVWGLSPSLGSASRALPPPWKALSPGEAESPVSLHWALWKGEPLCPCTVGCFPSLSAPPAPQKPAILTTLGVLEEPLGNARLHGSRLIAALLHTNTPSINQELCRLGTMDLLLVSTRGHGGNPTWEPFWAGFVPAAKVLGFPLSAPARSFCDPDPTVWGFGLSPTLSVPC